ncbi:MAG: sigma-70 family RNA polymerase sigma factor [Planctomycetota bacterium]
MDARANAGDSDSIELVRRAQDGELDALNALFGRYYERVRRVVRARLGARLRAQLDSGDILQETFVSAVRSFPSFERRDEASLIHWLARIAERQVNAAADRLGAAKRDPGMERALEHVRASLSSGDLRLEPAADVPLPPEQAARAELVQRVEECLAELKEEYREVILLRTYAGASWETVAALMGRASANACRMLHTRALVELAARVRGPGAD